MEKQGKKSVLIVDDEKANILALTHILGPAYTVYAAKNGRDAIETAQEHLPDLILLDILMPEMDGYEVLSTLKNTEETQKIPVIYITGLVTDEDEEKGMALGASDYITKPFSSEIVKLRVRNQMQILTQIEMINQRLRQQTLMTSISQSFLSNSDIDTLFTNTLHMLGEFMGIGQVLLFDLEEDGTTFTCRSEWVEKSFSFPSRIGSRVVLQDPIISVIRGLLSSESNLCLHSNDPAFRSAMKPYRTNFQKFIITPIFIRGKICAILDFSCDEDGKNWSESDINLATIAASILSGVYERSAMERQSSIVENSPQFIIYLSPGGELIYANPAASELTGHSKTEIMAGGMELIFDTETAQLIKSNYIPGTLRKGAESFEVNMTRRDGTIRTLAFTSFTAENGNIGAIAQDVTEMRALEAELVTAKEQAEQSSAAKTEFLARMSHEMHTPMNAIIGMTSIIKTAHDQNKTADCIEGIDNASRHLLSLIDDALDVSSLEKSKLKLKQAEYSFGTMLNEVLKTVQQYTEKKQQTLAYQIDHLIPDALIGDEERLSQVIRNLLMNASKFTPEQGAIQLNASAAGEEDGDLLLKIEVMDNGIGIPKEKQATIFNLFEQADGGVSRKFDGAGLGLTISKHLVNMMGGRIWVESESGKGAKFAFTIRTKSASGEKPAQGWPGESVKTFEGKTALLVDDVEMNREALKTLLEDTKIQIDCAENGLKAVKLFAAGPGRYDIILMDINMPVMDGWEAASRIRALSAPEGSRVKILAMTANMFREDVEKSREAGMDDHIGKPVDFNELLHKLNQYLT